VFLTRLTPASARQTYLMEDTEKREKLLKISKLADQMNDRLGKDFVRFAAMGYDQPWKMRQGWLSRRYTTRLDELLIIQSTM